MTLICKNIHHHNLARRPTWGHELRGIARRDGDSLRDDRGAARVQPYLDPQGDADINHGFSSVQWVVLGNVHRQSLVRIDF